MKRTLAILITSLSLLLAGVIEGRSQSTWMKVLGGSQYDRGYSVAATPDGGYVLAGLTTSSDGDMTMPSKGSSDIFLIKMSATGEVVWKAIYGGSQADQPSCITVTKEGHIVLAAVTVSDDGDFAGLNRGFDDIVVLRCNEDGKILWIKTFGGTGFDIANSVVVTPTDDIVIAGGTSSDDGDFENMHRGGGDICVLKLTSAGDVIWKKTYGGTRMESCEMIAISQDADVALTGFTNSIDGDFARTDVPGGLDIYVLVLDASGNIVKKLTTGGSSSDDVRSIASTHDGGYLIAGATRSNDLIFRDINKGQFDAFIMQLGADLNPVWVKTVGGASGDDVARMIAPLAGGGCVLTGSTKSNDLDFSAMNKGASDGFIMKLASDGTRRWIRTFGGSSVDDPNTILPTIDGGFVVVGITQSNDHTFAGMAKGNDDVFIIKLDSNGNTQSMSSVADIKNDVRAITIFPNPVVVSSTIRFEMDQPSPLRIELVNALGEVIRVLRDTYAGAGTHYEALHTEGLASGAYHLRMTTSDWSSSTMIIVR